MARLVTVVLILAVIPCVVAAPWEVPGKETGSSYNASPSRVSTVDEYIQHSIGEGSFGGNRFGDGSFSASRGGTSTGNGTGGEGGRVESIQYFDEWAKLPEFFHPTHI